MVIRKAVHTFAKPKQYALYLYKRILRLHYGLPTEARIMGDLYVKDEFRRHKSASREHSATFINEWTDYYVTLAKQLSSKGIAKGFIGKDLKPEVLESFAEEQLQQLLRLKKESEQLLSGTGHSGSIEAAGIKHVAEDER